MKGRDETVTGNVLTARTEQSEGRNESRALRTTYSLFFLREATAMIDDQMNGKIIRIQGDIEKSWYL